MSYKPYLTLFFFERLEKKGLYTRSSGLILPRMNETKKDWKMGLSHLHFAHATALTILGSLHELVNKDRIANALTGCLWYNVHEHDIGPIYICFLGYIMFEMKSGKERRSDTRMQNHTSEICEIIRALKIKEQR